MAGVHSAGFKRGKGVLLRPSNHMELNYWDDKFLLPDIFGSLGFVEMGES
jgi:hypothetical protein